MCCVTCLLVQRKPGAGGFGGWDNLVGESGMSQCSQFQHSLLGFCNIIQAFPWQH